MNNWPITAESDCSFEALAVTVLSLDAGIEWIALDQAGRAPRWGWRDASTGGVRTGTASADLAGPDPLLLLVAEGGDGPPEGVVRPHGLLYVLLAYADMTQIVARWGSDAYVSLGVGTAVDAHRLGKKLVRLLDGTAVSTLVQ